MKAKRKNAKKGLRRGKKIEAKRPLFMGLKSGAATGSSTAKPYLTFDIKDTTISSA